MSKKKKKDNTPTLLKVIRWIYPKVETIFPWLAHRFAVNLFFTPLRYQSPEKELKAGSFGEFFTVTAANKRIQCYKWGSSEKTVVVIHGWAGRATQFRRFVKPLLAAGYQVVGFDGPAHGRSEGKKTNILEFGETLEKIYEVVGIPEAIIAHSFGGPVSLVSAMNGLQIKTLVTIASPTIAEDILDSYLQIINGSVRTKEFFKKEVVRQTGKPFYEFSSLYAIKNINQKINLLLVYDEDDREISLMHPQALMQAYPTAELMQTKGLGHNRILKDDTVIKGIVTYIQRYTSV